MKSILTTACLLVCIVCAAQKDTTKPKQDSTETVVFTLTVQEYNGFIQRLHDAIDSKATTNVIINFLVQRRRVVKEPVKKQ